MDRLQDGRFGGLKVFLLKVNIQPGDQLQAKIFTCLSGDIFILIFLSMMWRRKQMYSYQVHGQHHTGECSKNV